jgi:hypothetical protein
MDYESRSQAQAATIPGTVTYVRTAGYYAAGDGGGALYKKTSAALLDGGFTSADGGKWDLVHAGVLNARQFGAKGDGATDDSASVTEMFSCAQAYYFAFGELTGVALYFPAGKYMLEGSFSHTGAIEIYGDGKQVTELCWTSGATTQVSAPNNIYAAVILSAFARDNHITVRDLGMKAECTNAGYALEIGFPLASSTVVPGVTIDNVKIWSDIDQPSNWWTGGIDLLQCWYYRVIDCDFIGSPEINDAEQRYFARKGIFIRNFSVDGEIRNFKASYVEVAIDGTDYFEGLRIGGCTLLNNHIGIRWLQTYGNTGRPHLVIDNNHIVSSGECVYFKDGNNAFITKNLLYQVSITPDEEAIPGLSNGTALIYLDHVGGAQILGNYIQGNRPTANTRSSVFGIKCVNVNFPLIAGNTFDVVTDGIYLDAATTYGVYGPNIYSTQFGSPITSPYTDLGTTNRNFEYVGSFATIAATSATASTSTTTGALTVAGGAGIAGAIYAGSFNMGGGVTPWAPFSVAVADASTNSVFGSNTSSLTVQNSNNTANNYVAIWNRDSAGSLNGGIVFKNINHTGPTGAIEFITRNGGTLGVYARLNPAGGLGLNTTSDPGLGMLYTNNGAWLIRSKATYSNGAGAAGGTLNNAPAAGNPTKWIPIDDNGTTRYIPAW